MQLDCTHIHTVELQPGVVENGTVSDTTGPLDFYIVPQPNVSTTVIRIDNRMLFLIQILENTTADCDRI
jgi:hypothetical protein